MIEVKFTITEEEIDTINRIWFDTLDGMEERCCQQDKDGPSCRRPAPYLAFRDYPICPKHAWALYDYGVDKAELEISGEAISFMFAFQAKTDGDSAPWIEPDPAFSWAQLRFLFNLRVSVGEAECFECQETVSVSFEECGGYCSKCWVKIKDRFKGRRIRPLTEILA